MENAFARFDHVERMMERRIDGANARANTFGIAARIRAWRHMRRGHRMAEAFARLDRRLAAGNAAAALPRHGVLAKLRGWIVSGVRRRRYRRMMSRLEVAHEPSSAALLAVLTERVARAANVDRPEDLVTAIALAERVVADYEAHVASLEQQRDRARAEAEKWQKSSAFATQSRADELAAAAQERAVEWERRAADAGTTLRRCEAGRRRILDALGQLRALARRVLASPERPQPDGR